MLTALMVSVWLFLAWYKHRYANSVNGFGLYKHRYADSVNGFGLVVSRLIKTSLCWQR